jgi:hypothetical protein
MAIAVTFAVTITVAVVTTPASADSTWSGSVTLTSSATSYASGDPAPSIDAVVDPVLDGSTTLAVYDDTDTLVCWTGAFNGGCSGFANAPVNGQRTYTAYVASGSTPTSQPPTAGVIASSAPITVLNRGWVGGIDLSAEPLGTDYFSLTASIDDSPPTYTLSLYDQTNWRVCSQSSYNRGCSALVPRPGSGAVTYTAYVADDAPQAAPPSLDVRAMSSVTMASDGTITSAPNGVSATALMALIETATDEDIEAMWLAWDASGLGTHIDESEITDQHAGYDFLRVGQGKTASQAMSQILKGVAGGALGGVLIWYLWKFFSPVVNQPPAPPNPPNPPQPPTNTRPTAATSQLSYLDRITEDFLERNPKAISWPEAQLGAAQCIAMTQFAIGMGALTGTDATDPCENQIVFLPGGEFQATTEHDWNAIVVHPTWLRLNWMNQVDRGATLAEGWYRYTEPCAGNITGDTGQGCDEYPFYASAQSGPGADLKLLDHNQNIRAGRRYQTFAGRCKLDSDPINTAFLVVPMDFPNAPATFEVCE